MRSFSEETGRLYVAHIFCFLGKWYWSSLCTNREKMGDGACAAGTNAAACGWPRDICNRLRRRQYPRWCEPQRRCCGTTRSTSRSTSRPVKDQLSRRGVCWKLQGLQSTSLARAAAARLTTCRRLSHTFLSSSRPSCHNGSSTWSCCISHSGASKLRGML